VAVVVAVVEMDLVVLQHQHLVVEMVEMRQTELEPTDVIKKAVVAVLELEGNNLAVEMVATV
jgi:hypothetical protein